MTKKISYGLMALIDWSLEKPGRRAFKTSSSYNPLMLYESSETDSEGKPIFSQIYPNDNSIRISILERLGGRDKIDIQPIRHLVNQRQHGREIILRPTRQLQEFWEQNLKEDFLKMKEAREDYRQSVKRQVILGRRGPLKPVISKELTKKVPSDITLPLPPRMIMKPRYIATVVKETQTRVYLTDVKPLEKVESYLNPMIQGHAPNQYAAIEDVIADNANEYLADRMMSLIAEFQQEINEVANRTIEEILPAILTMNDRFIQKDAALDDMMRELIEHKTSETTGPKP